MHTDIVSRPPPFPGGYSSSLFDASPTATPSFSPVSGTFALALSTPEASNAGCLPQASQAAAWDCSFSASGGEGAELAIVVGQVGGQGPSGAYVFYASNNNTINYGMQTPDTAFAQFITVQDNEDTGAGPAFYFQQTYDKIVVLEENAFPSRSTKSKRQAFELPSPWSNQKQVAVGEQPWFCIWNNTFIEGFIYVEETANLTGSPSSSYLAAISAAPSSTASSTSTSYLMPSSTTSSPTSTSYPPTSSSTTSTGPTYSSPVEQLNPYATPSPSSSSFLPPVVRPRDMSDLYNQLQYYPLVVKLEERRVPTNGVGAYCQKMQVLNDGTAGIVTDDDGNAVTFLLDEVDPAYGAYKSAGVAGKRSVARDVTGGCRCEWSSG